MCRDRNDKITKLQGKITTLTKHAGRMANIVEKQQAEIEDLDRALYRCSEGRDLAIEECRIRDEEIEAMVEEFSLQENLLTIATDALKHYADEDSYQEYDDDGYVVMTLPSPNNKPWERGCKALQQIKDQS